MSEAWPELDDAALAAHVAACRERGAKREYLEPIKLAWAAAHGDSAALRELEPMLAEECNTAARRVHPNDATFADEVRQAVRVRLLVAERSRVDEATGRHSAGSPRGSASATARHSASASDRRGGSASATAIASGSASTATASESTSAAPSEASKVLATASVARESATASVARESATASVARESATASVARESTTASEASLPRIADYAGRGPLGGWLGVAALRVALNLRRGAKPASLELFAELGTEEDPELRHLKTMYRAEFREALEAALFALPERQRALLRLSYVDGLRHVQLARLYGVHETTVARWVAAAANQVGEDARKRLMTRLSLSPASLDSVARMVLSNLDLSIARVLGH
ncbi:MAG: sigma factor-like helix-turn-helix DNA-binding protein [Kofleriaceae bacterium]